MNAKYCFLTFAIIVGFALSGCNSEPAKTEAETKKAFLGGPPPKGYMGNMGGGNAAPGGAPQAAQEAAAKAAAKAQAENAGK